MKKKRPILFISSIILATITSGVFGYLGLPYLYLLFPISLTLIALLVTRLEQQSAGTDEALTQREVKENG